MEFGNKILLHVGRRNVTYHHIIFTEAKNEQIGINVSISLWK